MSFLFWSTFVLFVLVSLLLIGLVLIQKGRGGGLAGAFGGMGGNTAFGSKTGDVLTWTTAIGFGIFLVLAIALNLLANARNNPTGTTAPPPVTGTPTAAPGSLGNNTPAVPDTRLPAAGNPPAATDTQVPATPVSPLDAAPQVAPATQPGT
jgi:preprotein translocase subunit SecG